MDIGKAFGFVAEDERWLPKVLIGGLISIVPILNFAVLGYMLGVARNVAQGNPRPLPEWDNLGEHFMRGLHAFVIGLVYSLPIILIISAYICITIATATGGRSGEAIGSLFACLLVPFMIILGVGSALLSYAAQARYVATNDLGQALRFGDVIAGVRGNPGPWLMLLVVGILAGFVAGLGIIACGIGVLFTSFYSQCVMGHALGQTVVQQGAFSGLDQAPPPGYGAPPSYQ